MNMVARIDGQPKLCNLKELDHQAWNTAVRVVHTQRTVFELRRA
jgi:DNA gyrase/topoisomerase IV subunit A